MLLPDVAQQAEMTMCASQLRSLCNCPLYVHRETIANETEEISELIETTSEKYGIKIQTEPKS